MVVTFFYQHKNFYNQKIEMLSWILRAIEKFSAHCLIFLRHNSCTQNFSSNVGYFNEIKGRLLLHESHELLTLSGLTSLPDLRALRSVTSISLMTTCVSGIPLN